jgi:DNA-directed RNA polymerase specialized sigma24 family protein
VPNHDDSENSVEFLLTEAGARRFFERTAPALARQVPPWCPEVAWDATVDAYLAVAKHPERFQAAAQAHAYARTKARRDRGRRRRRTWDREVLWEDRHSPADSRTPDAAFLASEELDGLLGRLPAYLRQTVLAIKGDGLTAEEFAVREGIAVQTVVNRVHIALKLLRRFKQEGEAP